MKNIRLGDVVRFKFRDILISGTVTMVYSLDMYERQFYRVKDIITDKTFKIKSTQIMGEE